MQNNKNIRASARLRNQVPIRYLSKMAFMGLDASFAALAARQNCAANVTKCDMARRFRPRYKTNSMPAARAKTITQHIPSEMLDIPFRALVRPMGKGSFLALSEHLPRSVTVGQVVDQIQGDTGLYSKFSDVSQFKSQAIASISFHCQIFGRYGITHIESDVLDYIFDKGQSASSIAEEMNEVSESISQLILHDTQVSGKGYHPIENVTADAISFLGRWKKSSFDVISKEVRTFPKLLGCSNGAIDLQDPEYPESLKRLSVFAIASVSHRLNIAKKMAVLHKVGLCAIEDLLLLTDRYRSIFTDKRVRSKISSLPKARSYYLND